MIAATTSQLPMAALWFAFVATTTWTLFQLVSFIFSTLRKSELDFRLTRGFFWRMSFEGESFFVQSVSYALNGDCRINDVQFELQMLGEKNSKTFSVEFHNLGNLLASSGVPFGEHNFYSSSPINYVSASSVDRNVFRSILAGYDDEIQTLVDTFMNEVSKSSEAEETVVPGLVSTYTKLLMDKVQIEPGKYRFVAIVKYQGRMANRWRKERTLRSSLTFELPSNVRDTISRQLEDTLSTLALNAISGSPVFVNYPELSPQNIAVEVAQSTKS